MPSLRKLLQLGLPTINKLSWKQKPFAAQFNDIVYDSLSHDRLLLDAGCGKICRASAQGKCKMVIGIDKENQTSCAQGTDETIIGDLRQLPFKSGVFDVITSWMVLEHLNDPQACFREFNRVCKEGGLVILATPNLLHYSNLVVRLTPYWFHEWFIKAILCGSGGSHPTTYKANTPKKLTSMMEKAGFEKEDVRLLDFGPAYLHWLTPAYAIGMIYHRVVNRFNRLSFLRGTIIGVFSKIATI